MVRNHFEWDIYCRAFDAAMEVFLLTKSLPSEERYSLSDQLRRSSRSVAANLAEAWRRRRYEGNFVLRLNDAESEAAETQTWLAFAVKCGYLQRAQIVELYTTYDNLIGALVNLQRHPQPWLLTSTRRHSGAVPDDPKTPRP
jgi:four helix bundle protein